MTGSEILVWCSVFLFWKGKKNMEIFPSFFSHSYSLQGIKFSLSQMMPSWDGPDSHKTKTRQKHFKHRSVRKNQKPPLHSTFLPISSTRLTVHTHLWMLFFYHHYCVIKTFGVLFIKGKEYYPGEKALHLPELITVHFTGNKVCGIHFFVAINQDGNKWLNLKPPGSHNQSISWYSPLVCSTCFSSKPILAW